MKSILNKITTTLAGGAVFCLGALMAGLGLAVMVTLAMFALAIAALGLLAAPFLGHVVPNAQYDEPMEPREATA